MCVPALRVYVLMDNWTWQRRLRGRAMLRWHRAKCRIRSCVWYWSRIFFSSVESGRGLLTPSWGDKIFGWRRLPVSRLSGIWSDKGTFRILTRAILLRCSCPTIASGSPRPLLSATIKDAHCARAVTYRCVNYLFSTYIMLFVDIMEPTGHFEWQSQIA